MKFKIVAVDNYDRESKADRLVCDNIDRIKEAECMCDALNRTNSNSDDYYRVMPEDYKLWGGMKELV